MRPPSFFQPFIGDLERSLFAVTDDLSTELGLQSPEIHPVNFASFSHAGIGVAILRLDQIHPVVSGNKWYKLKFNIAEALHQNAKTLITFGGAWSNHLHAFSYVGRALGLKTIAYIRGQEWQSQKTPLLDDIQNWGTQVIAIDRAEYRLRNQFDYQRAIQKRHPESYLIPEGGDNYLGLLGMSSVPLGLSESGQAVWSQSNTVALACGTGNSFAGIRLALPRRHRLLGIAALKGQWYSTMMTQKFAGFWPLTQSNWQVFTRFHGGGFGKINSEIQEFSKKFETETQIQLDPVYTAKLVYGIAELASEGFFPTGHRLLLIHTGGLQGRRSLLLNT